MGWSILPLPGSKTRDGELAGPCIDPACGHKLCELTRRQATSICPICGKPIGYDVKFYQTKLDGVEHALCVWRQAET